MTFLLCFFGGIIFISFLFPVFESLSTLACNFLEYLSSKIVKKLYIIKKEAQELSEESNNNSSIPMGFYVRSSENQQQEGFDQEDDIEDKSNKKERKIR